MYLELRSHVIEVRKGEKMLREKDKPRVNVSFISLRISSQEESE